MGGRVRGRVEVEEGGQWWSTPLSTRCNTRRRETRGNGTNDRWDSAPLQACHGCLFPTTFCR